MKLRLLSSALLTLSICTLPLLAADRPFELTIDSIMRGHQLVGNAPEDVRWSADGRLVYFSWKLATDPVDDDAATWVVGRDGSGLRRLSEAEARNAPPARGIYTRDRRRALFTRDGNIWLYDSSTQRSVPLVETSDRESSPRFTADEQAITFVRGNNLFLLSPRDGTIRQLTSILGSGEKMGADWEDEKLTDSQKYVRDEEKKLLGIVERRQAKEAEEREKRKKEHPRKPMQLKSGQQVSSIVLSADRQFAVVTISEDGSGRDTNVPSFVTTSGYTTDIPSRTKVGDAQGRSRIFSMNTTTGEVKWLEPGIKLPAAESTGRTEDVKSNAAESQTTSTDKTTDKTKSAAETVAATPTKGTETTAVERDVDLGSLVWSADGTKAALAVRSLDNKDRWILSFDPSTAKTKILATMHDDAWITWLGEDVLGFTASDEIYYISEETGYAHLYSVPWAGGTPKALTSGKWEVKAVDLSPDRKTFYLMTSEESPFVHKVYSMASTGGPRTRLTASDGEHQTVVSPDGTMIADVYSYTNRPPELYLQKLTANASPVKITSSPLPEFWTYPWQDPPIVMIPARDGAQVPAHLYRPANYKGGPAVIFVHGAGYLQNVDRWWSYYFREYMFHHLLMERGYLVLDIDYRASEGYGRDWRTAIYRHMGGKDLDDHVDAAKWLVATQNVDSRRIGIYGGSYGGFITLMAMFTQPDVFAAGAALRPVTDWAHYNHEYTSNILNVPQKDREAYVRSSPIYFAEGLKGALLICHGMVDTNVHFQDTVRLEQRLIELRKTNWQVAAYPVEDHSFVEATSWADEYKRILKLFDENLAKKN